MNCDKARDLLPLYLSGELKGEELEDMQLHVQDCERCARAVNADRELDAAFRTAMLEETPDVSAVLQRVHAQMSAPWWKRARRLVSMRLAGAVTMIAVIALVSLPWLYVHRVERNMALNAAIDHYSDLVLLRHADWDSKPEDVARFMQTQFPGRQDLLASITPKNYSFEKVRVCNLGGTSYAHFIFKQGAAETSVFILTNAEGRERYQAAHLSDGAHGLEVSGFSAAGLSGMVVGKQGTVPTEEIADRLAKTL